MSYKRKERDQMTFLPSMVEDYISQHDPVRVYDAFCDALDFSQLGIPIVEDKQGQEEYYPRDMLKLLVYGYSYGIRSSRKLEQANCHNLSFMWLMGGLKPDYRTIARFRVKHKDAIKKALKQCVKMCIDLDLIEGSALFVDGSPFRANASIRKTWTKQRCEEHLKKVSDHIDKLVDESENLDIKEDEQGSLVSISKEIKDKKELKAKIEEIASKLDDNKKLHNTVDSDSCIVKGRQGTHAGYNAQLVVDTKHGLIVHSEALTHNQDYNKLSDQVQKATEVLEKKPETVSTDCGYYSLKDIAKVDSDITVVIPSIKQAQKEKNLHPLKPFDKEQFKYDKDKDEYICPKNKRLKFSFRQAAGERYYRANPKNCKTCFNFGQCTSSNSGRQITRLREEELKENLQHIYLSQKGQEIYKLRKAKVELPFGHIKRNLGASQFLLRTKPKVDAELSILSICFNVVRMITLIGAPSLILKLNGYG